MTISKETKASTKSQPTAPVPKSNSATQSTATSSGWFHSIKWRLLRVCYQLSTLAIIAMFLVLMGAMANTLPALLLVGFVAAIWRGVLRWKPRGWEYGTARWASLRDIVERRFLFHRDGFIVGKINLPVAIQEAGVGHTWRALWDFRFDAAFACRLFQGSNRNSVWSDELVVIPRHEVVHAAVYGGTGSGKSQSSAIPNIKASLGSVVVLDPKAELAKLTALDRAKRFGQRTVIVDPFGVAPEPFRADAFNPLSVVSVDSPLALNQAAYLAQAMIKKEKNENNPFFSNSAELVVDGILSFLFAHSTPRDCTLQKLREITADPQAFDEVVNLMQQSTAQGGHIRRKGLQLAALEGKTLTDVRSTLNTQLAWLDSPIIESSTRETTFPIEELVNHQLSIYFILPPHLAESYAPLVRVWVTAVASLIFSAGESRTRQVTFYFDEASLLGPNLPVLETILTKGRSYGLRSVSYWQSPAQLTQVYPEEQAATYRDNMSVEQFMGINSFNSAKEVSQWIGQTTIQTRSEQISSGTTWQPNQPDNSRSHSENYSATTQNAARALIQPEEILQLGDEATVVLKPRCPPMVLRGIRDYRMKDRLLVDHVDVHDRIQAFKDFPTRWTSLKKWLHKFPLKIGVPVGCCLIVCCLWFTHLNNLSPAERNTASFSAWSIQNAMLFKEAATAAAQSMWNDLKTLTEESQ